MTSDEFWKDDPSLLASYRTFYINKKKREYEENNYKSWLQGLYIHDGNSILTNTLLVGISKFFGNKSQHEKKHYPFKPYTLSREEETKPTKEKEHKKYFNSLTYYASLKKRFIQKIKKGE